MDKTLTLFKHLFFASLWLIMSYGVFAAWAAHLEIANKLTMLSGWMLISLLWAAEIYKHRLTRRGR